jgi:hypothetical protein
MSIDEFSQATGAASESVESTITTINAAKSVGEGLAGHLAALGLEGKAARTNDIAQRLESEAAAAAALKDRLDGLRQEIEGLKGALQGGGTSPRTATDSARTPQDSSTQPATPSVEPAGEWATPPKRSFGNPFNARYEQWVKTSNGGPDDEKEYLVRGVWFDARRFENTASASTEVLLDAKGQYDKFIDRRTGDWQKFFSKFEKSGIKGLVKEAERQVAAAGGQPVEWWCAERDSARLMRRQFNLEPKLRGRIKVRFMPMPEEGKLPL